MARGMMASVKTDHPKLYLAGIILVLVVGIVCAIVGFVSGNSGLGIFGVILAVVAAIFLVEDLATQ